MSRRFDEPTGSVEAAFGTAVPNSARIWEYLLGGKEHYPADREAGERVIAQLPEVVAAARHERAFLARAVGFLVGEAGVRQFLDCGSGLPSVDNTHEVAQRVAPDARVVYVDNDPLVLAHARALLTSSAEGACGHVGADVRHTEAVLDQAAGTLDFARPVGLLMSGILDHIADDGQAQATAQKLVAALAPGSYLVIAHPTDLLHGSVLHKAIRQVTELGGAPTVARTPEQITAFFAGLELLEPGVVSCSHWRPGPWPPETAVLQFCGVARKPAVDAPAPRTNP